jgi:hypothetical protein
LARRAHGHRWGDRSTGRGRPILHSAKDLHGYRLEARDGGIGTVDELLFSDADWTVRWAVADTGSWLEDRRTLISPLAVTDVDDAAREVAVALTREQVEGSPPVTRDQPVSRQHEVDLHHFYGWPYYWGGVGAWGPGFTPAELLEYPPPEQDPGAAAGDPHLQSSRDVIGHRIEAADGDIGHVEDLLYDDRTWRVELIVVDTRNWLPGRKVRISPADVEEIDWVEGCVRVRLTRDAIERAPDAEDVGA